jgi:hypothetical protein
MPWDHTQPFPPDPNAPATRRTRPSTPPPASATTTAAAQHPAALDRALAQLRLIGPAAGNDLRRLIHGNRDLTHR